ncbi:MAG: alpha/beta hydrolase [Chloroflexota bacterium]
MQLTQWQADILGQGFEARRLDFPDDYEGEVYATLVRRLAETPTTQAFLHIHGFTDYFFQTHLADWVNAQGMNFYALDLRKYGRSLADHQKPNFCHDLHEYFADIDAALKIITEEDSNTWTVIEAHSTGGLTSALYADHGQYRDRVDALCLNSPFFDWNLTAGLHVAVQVLALTAPLAPAIATQPDAPIPYIESIHKDHHGEWDFDFAYRPLIGFPVFAGWCRAINKGHARLRDVLNVQCPVLVMHADKAIHGSTWTPAFQTGDSILNPEHIKRYAKYTGADDLTLVEIENGLHDVFLSSEEARLMVYDALATWLQGVRVSPVKINEQ